VRFLLITLIVHAPDPVTGVQKSTADRFAEVIGNARLAEELGFDGFGVGERHERPFISSSPPVVLSHIAALTSRIRLFTAVTTLSLLDPVRAYEDYATLDHLSGGRLELHLHADAGGLTDTQHRESLELFQAEIAPALRRDIPDPPWAWGPVGIEDGGVSPGGEPQAAGAGLASTG
jgi:alkanesulfonate monooxygenase SsuD/methylene tetrahydromethanopterin reductase-like flavin-dependent oxidoreductase (luciferase family)